MIDLEPQSKQLGGLRPTSEVFLIHETKEYFSRPQGIKIK